MNFWPRPLQVAVALLILAGLLLLLLGIVIGGVAGLLIGAAGLLLSALPMLIARQLRYRDTSDWVVTWDLAEGLQFAAYVGEREDIRSAANHDAATPLKQSWQQWWQRLVADTFAHEAALDATLRTYADLPPQSLARLIATPTAHSFDPPSFASLQDVPELQARCQEHWSSFAAVWALEKPALLAQMRRQGTRVRDDRIVRSSARAANRATITPFFLRIDFVRWPRLFQQRVSEQHLLLGTYYLQASAAPELEAIIAGAVRELI